MKLDYRYMSELKCSNCNVRVRESKTAILLALGFGLIGTIIAIAHINLAIKIILLILLTILSLYIDIFIIPLVKDE